MKRFSYTDYEKRLRQPQYAWIREHQRGFVRYFEGCHQVLDIACGQGLFLELLAEHNIPAFGVDTDASIVAYAQSRGNNVIHDNALTYLRTASENFDGVFCAHFIEHLPFDSVLDLIEAIHQALQLGGVLVLVFPNPKSLRVQLFGFWQDPQHVRMYHGELIRAVLEHYGFVIEEYLTEIPPSMSPNEAEGDSITGITRLKRRIQGWLMRKLGVEREIGRLRVTTDFIARIMQQDDEVVIVAHKSGVPISAK